MEALVFIIPLFIIAYFYTQQVEKVKVGRDLRMKFLNAVDSICKLDIDRCIERTSQMVFLDEYSRKLNQCCMYEPRSESDGVDLRLPTDMSYQYQRLDEIRMREYMRIHIKIEGKIREAKDFVLDQINWCLDYSEDFYNSKLKDLSTLVFNIIDYPEDFNLPVDNYDDYFMLPKVGV